MIQITETQARQILACISSAIYKEDEWINETQKKCLIQYSEELCFDLANMLGVNDAEWNESYIHPITLKFKKFE